MKFIDGKLGTTREQDQAEIRCVPMGEGPQNDVAHCLVRPTSTTKSPQWPLVLESLISNWSGRQVTAGRQDIRRRHVADKYLRGMNARPKGPCVVVGGD